MATLMMQDIRLLYNMGALPAPIRAEAERLIAERDRVRENALGRVHSVTEDEQAEEISIADIAEDWLKTVDIEEEEAYPMDTTTVGDDDDDADLEALFAQAEQDLLNAVLIEVGEEEPSFE